MGKKIAGKLNQPPAQADFNDLPLASFCRKRSGVFYRLHSVNRATGDPWDPLHFSQRGNSRFDPAGGVGTLCVAMTLAGGLMELLDDYWGAVGSMGRSVTEQTLRETWVSLVALPPVVLFDATGANLSKIGTDAQMLTGDYATTRDWASRIIAHHANIDGILYRSRHDPARLNVALFQRDALLPAILDDDLTPAVANTWRRKRTQGPALVCGPPILLRDHPLLHESLVELQVARLP